MKEKQVNNIKTLENENAIDNKINTIPMQEKIEIKGNLFF